VTGENGEPVDVEQAVEPLVTDRPEGEGH